jgi:AraC-like DNA-binding protein
MARNYETAVNALGTAVIEQPRDIFAAAGQSSFVKELVEPSRLREPGRVEFAEVIGAGNIEYLEFEEEFVAVFPRFSFSTVVPIRFADSKWIRMHFRIGGRNTTYFDEDEKIIVGPLCNLTRLPDGMLATEMHTDEQLNWLTVFCKPAMLLSAFGLDRMDLPASLRAACSDRADRLVLESFALPAAAWRLLADLDCDAGASPVALARRQAMVTELVCLLLERLTGAPQEERPLSTAERERILAARDLILRNLHAPPTIASLARAVGTNRTSLTQGFRSHFGQSIYDTIKTERMAVAIRVLQEGASVGETAHRLGYSSTAAFSFAFKQCFGVAPSQSKMAT